MKQWCEGCQKYEEDAYRRPEIGGKVLCNRRYYMALRKNTPSQYVYRPYPLNVEKDHEKG